MSTYRTTREKKARMRPIKFGPVAFGRYSSEWSTFSTMQCKMKCLRSNASCPLASVEVNAVPEQTFTLLDSGDSTTRIYPYFVRPSSIGI
jgi:hypothetical protein